MHPERLESASKNIPSYLDGHALESRNNPGRYVQSEHYPIILVTRLHPPDPKDHHKSRYGEILRHGHISLRQNAEQAYEMNFGQWVEMCRDGGPWDYESSPVMQEGVRQAFYTQGLLVRFRGFHLGWTGAALQVVTENANEWMKHVGLRWDEEALRRDVIDGWTCYQIANDDPPRNDPFFRRRMRRADAFEKSNAS
jgi:hypothetical protein